jgi:ribosomal protein S18 acetylase RimI-like enzyme
MPFVISTVDETNRSDLGAVRELWTAYWRSLRLPDDFQGFQTELNALPGRYRSPKGRLLLAKLDEQPAATVAFCALSDHACEMKRLYVEPLHRRRGIASELIARALTDAKLTGYRTVYADTLPTMHTALAMYRRLGFQEVAAYAPNPTPGAIYLRLDISALGLLTPNTERLQ